MTTDRVKLAKEEIRLQNEMFEYLMKGGNGEKVRQISLELKKVQEMLSSKND